MSKYTLEGSKEFDLRIDADISRIVERVSNSPIAKYLKGIVLLGGYGRGEGTPLKNSDGTQSPFNDYDFIVVGKLHSTAWKKNIKQHLHSMEHELSEELGIPVDLHFESLSSLAFAENSLLNYEMKQGHKIVWGPQNLLKILPDYQANNVPLQEGTRLLFNRGALLLHSKLHWSEKTSLSKEEQENFLKYIMKSHLAFGDCLLLASNVYTVSYIDKVQRIEGIKRYDLAGVDQLASWYKKAVQFKNEGDFSIYDNEDIYSLFEKTVQYFQVFFLWFEKNRLKQSIPNPLQYTHCLGNSDPIDRQMFKSIAKNYLSFGTKGAFLGWKWMIMNPRNRLFASLLMLLQKNHSEEELNCTANLLCSNPDTNVLYDKFFELWGKFS